MRNNETVGVTIQIFRARRRSFVKIGAMDGSAASAVTIRFMIGYKGVRREAARPDSFTIFLDNFKSSWPLSKREYQWISKPLRTRRGFEEWAQRSVEELAEALISEPAAAVCFIDWLTSLESDNRVWEFDARDLDDDGLTMSDQFGWLTDSVKFALLLAPADSYQREADRLERYLSTSIDDKSIYLASAPHWSEARMVITICAMRPRSVQDLGPADRKHLLRLNKAFRLAEEWAVQRALECARHARMVNDEQSLDNLHVDCTIHCRGAQRIYSDNVIVSVDYSPGWGALLEDEAVQTKFPTHVTSDVPDWDRIMEGSVRWTAHRLFYHSDIPFNRILMIEDLFVELSVTHQQCLPIR